MTTTQAFESVFKNDAKFLFMNYNLHTTTDAHGNTPLMLAAKLDRYDLVKILIASAGMRNDAGVNAFFVAVAHGSLKSMTLLQSSADFTQKLLQSAHNLPRGSDLLTAAMESSSPEGARLVRELYQKKYSADPGNPSLMLKLNQPERFVAFARRLEGLRLKAELQYVAQSDVATVKQYAQLRAELLQIDEAGRSVAHYLALGGVSDLSLMNALRSMNVNFELEDNGGMTPLNLAVKLNNTGFSRHFVAVFGAVQMQKNPLTQALQLQFEEMTEILCPSYLVAEGLPTIFQAAMGRSDACFKTILEHQIGLKTTRDVTIQLPKHVNFRQFANMYQQLFGSTPDQNKTVIKEGLPVSQFLQLIGDEKKIQIVDEFYKYSSVYLPGIVNLGPKSSLQEYIIAETTEVIKLLKSNSAKYQEEYEMKIDCLIGYYEGRLSQVMQALKEAEDERNRIADLVGKYVDMKSVNSRSVAYKDADLHFGDLK